MNSNRLQDAIQSAINASNPEGLNGIVKSLLSESISLLEQEKIRDSMLIMKELLKFGYLEDNISGSSDIDLYSKSFQDKLKELREMRANYL